MLTEQQRRELDWEKTDGLMPGGTYEMRVQHCDMELQGKMQPEWA